MFTTMSRAYLPRSDAVSACITTRPSRRRKDGSLIEISLSVSPILDDRGVVIGASKIARDITERNVAFRRVAWEQEATSRLYEIGRRCARADVGIKEILFEALATAIWITQADKGNVQFYDDESRTLKILVQSGFETTLSRILCKRRRG